MTTPGDRGTPPDASSGPDDPYAPPRLLARPAAPPTPLPPVHGSEEVAVLHLHWSQLTQHGRTFEDEAPGPGTRTPAGVRAKVRARVATAATDAARTAQQRDRELIGDLIRAVDLVARRLDDVASRVAHMEALVQDVVETVSEDLTRLRVALAAQAGHDREGGTGGPAGPPPATS